MPGMDGLEATRTIRRIEYEHRRKPAVILTLSANARTSDLEAIRDYMGQVGTAPAIDVDMPEELEARDYLEGRHAEMASIDGWALVGQLRDYLSRVRMATATGAN